MKKAIKKIAPTIKLDLSVGALPADSTFLRPKGFDPLRFPWSLKTASVREAHSAYLLARVPQTQRTPFMEELWRVLVPGGTATIIVPYWTSVRAIQDPTTAWPPFCEQSFLYYNKQFRQANQLDYAIACDFDFVYGYTLDPETQARPDDSRPFWVKHYTNAISDLQLVLTKRP